MKNYCYLNLSAVLLVQIIFGSLYGIGFYDNQRDDVIKKKFEYNIVILLHLNNLSLMDEFITKINNFITLNNTNKYYIKINIPVHSNITNFTKFCTQEKKFSNNILSIYKQCLDMAPYHPQVITQENCIRLHVIKSYLENNLSLEPRNIQIIFSENRGVDIGGFFILLDQLIIQNIPHDFIIKLHTKSHTGWRKKLLSMLDIDLNKTLQNKEYIYACNRHLTSKHATFHRVLPRLTTWVNYFNLPYKDRYNHCAGTMFIVSEKMTNFFKSYDRLAIFNMLNMGYPKNEGFQLEHGFECFFGYLFDHLHLKTVILSDHIKDHLNDYQ